MKSKYGVLLMRLNRSLLPVHVENTKEQRGPKERTSMQKKENYSRKKMNKKMNFLIKYVWLYVMSPDLFI